jgi:DivIVA domain-containing protein
MTGQLITAEEAVSVRFDTVRWRKEGYDIDQVDEHLENVETTLMYYERLNKKLMQTLAKVKGTKTKIKAEFAKNHA